MSSPSPGPNDESPDRTPRPDQQDYAYGRLYGRAPRSGGSGGSGGGPGLRTVYTFVLVWATTALIMWYGSRLLGFGRGDIGAAVVSFVVSLIAAIVITAWARNRRR